MNFFEQLLEAADNFFQGRVRNKELEMRLQDDLKRRQREEEDRQHLLWQRQREKQNAERADDLFQFEALERDLAPIIDNKTREKIAKLGERVATLQGLVLNRNWRKVLAERSKEVAGLRATYKFEFGDKGDEWLDKIFSGDLISQFSNPEYRPTVEALLKSLYGEEEGQRIIDELKRAQEQLGLHREGLIKEVRDYLNQVEAEVLAELQLRGVNIYDERVRNFVRSRIFRIQDNIGAWAASQYRANLENRYLLEALTYLDRTPVAPQYPPATPQQPPAAPQGGGR